MISIPAQPYAFDCAFESTALVIIDVQRDFVEPGGFGELLGNDVSHLRSAIVPIQRVLSVFRAQKLHVFHTREGHKPDLSDLHTSKRQRGNLSCGIGDIGPMGRILVQGEHGHDIIEELSPLPDEPVIDKPGKGSFYATNFESLLQSRGIKSLVVTGVTTEVCVHTTVREANDRGYNCLVLSDCVGSYFPEFQEVGLRMIAAQGGIFGWVSTSEALLSALNAPVTP